MAEARVATKIHIGNGKTLDSYDIVEAKTEWGGTYDTCGKCGVNLKTGRIDQDARDKMAAELEKAVFNPLGLLAGLLANVKEEDDYDAGISVVGYLLGLALHGARKELEIQQMGGSGAYWLMKLVEDHGKDKEGAA